MSFNSCIMIGRVVSPVRRRLSDRGGSKATFEFVCPEAVAEVRLLAIAFGKLADSLELRESDWVILSGTLQGSVLNDQRISFVLMLRDVQHIVSDPQQVLEQQPTVVDSK